jgi:hypothetical protein
MQTFKNVQKNKLILLLNLLVVLIYTCTSTIASAEISVDSYCQLTIQSMQQEASNLQELLSIANQYVNNQNELIRQEQIKKADFEKKKIALYSSFGTSADDYVLYMGGHSAEVNEYFKNNPDIKQQIDSLTAQINSLLAQYESIKGHNNQPPPLPKP